MDPIVGRDQELALVRQFAGGLRDGPRALLLEGEAGIGKTAVWRAALAEAEAAGCRVLRCVAEQIDVSRNGGRVRLFRNVGSITMDFDGIESMVLRALGGNDRVTIDPDAELLITPVVDLGADEYPGKETDMTPLKLYVIRRRDGWRTPEELQESGAKSARIGDDEMSDDIRWIRTYAVHESDGGIGTVCVYQASSPEKIREHASRVGMPADEIVEVADTVFVRPDPEPAPV